VSGSLSSWQQTFAMMVTVCSLIDSVVHVLVGKDRKDVAIEASLTNLEGLASGVNNGLM